jgi:hypothetical protein
LAVGNKANDLFWKDPIGKQRAYRGLPLQVYSCWNGGVVIDAMPFYEHVIKFRRGKPNECSESECSLFCKDLWNLGYGKIALVPNIALAYSFEDYEKVRTPWENLKLHDETLKPFYARDLLLDECESKECSSPTIDWKPIPKKVFCLPLADVGVHDVDWTNALWIDPSTV